MALLLVAYHRLHSAWAIALVLLADFVPGIVLAVPFGALADRFSRKRLAVGADLLRAAAFCALAVIPSFAATVGFALIAGVGSALFRPAFNAALPGMVSDEQRSTAPAIYSANFSIGTTVGPGLTALVLLFGPATLMLAVNGATFLVSAALLSTVSLASAAGSRRDPDPDPDPEPEPESAWAATLEGARTAARLPGVGALLVIATGMVLASSLMNVAEPLLATGPLHAGSSGYSVLVAIFGVGLVAGTFVERPRRVTRERAAAAVHRRTRAPVCRHDRIRGGAESRLGDGELRADRVRQRHDRRSGDPAVPGTGRRRGVGARVRTARHAQQRRFRDGLVTASLVLAAVGVRAVFALGGVGLGVLAVAACLGLRPSRAGEPVTAVPGTAVAT